MLPWAALGVTAFRLRVAVAMLWHLSFGEVGVRSMAADLETAPFIFYGHVEPEKRIGCLYQMFVCLYELGVGVWNYSEPFMFHQ